MPRVIKDKTVVTVTRNKKLESGETITQTVEVPTYILEEHIKRGWKQVKVEKTPPPAETVSEAVEVPVDTTDTTVVQEQDFGCDSCDKSFGKAQGLRMHKMKAHA